jgi:hypothetical protein
LAAPTANVEDSACRVVVGAVVVRAGAVVVLVGAVVDRAWVFEPAVFVWGGAPIDAFP